MRRLLRMALFLYPPAWRRRYGPEMEALFEDVQPGWLTLADVCRSALVMQVTGAGRIPVVFALWGVLVGCVVVWFTPQLYASSSTVRFGGTGEEMSEAALIARLQTALAPEITSKGVRDATRVEVIGRTSVQTTLRVTYLSRDAVDAQRVVSGLTRALAGSGGASVVQAPALPTSPIRPDYWPSAGVGGLLGLLVGGIVLIVRWRHSLQPRG